MSDNNVYQYSKITSQGTIRLMQLQPSPDLQAPVHCSIVHETLAKYENSLLEFYIAVSYVWGDSNIKSTISVDGDRLEITSSLEEALRHIRDGERMLHVWADGVCIHQNDTEDRNLQVSQMGSIYSTAQHTIIFLGPSSPVSEYLLKLMEPMTPEEKSHAFQLRVPPGSLFEELLDHHILSLPWFTRTWIFQELVLSNDPWVQIGRFRIKWLHFGRHILPVPESKWTDKFKLLSKMSEARTNIRHLNECKDPGNTAEILLDLLSSRRGLGVSDPRDVIYANLGMISMKTQAFVYSDQSRISTTSYKEEAMAINYNKTVVQIFEDTTRFLFQNTSWISMLQHVEEVDQGERRQGLPSWVPDWTLQWTPKSPPPDEVDEVNNRRLRYRLEGWLDSFPPDNRRVRWLDSFIVSGVLAVPGHDFGCVIAVLHESVLPNQCFQQRRDTRRRQATMVQLIDWIESPTTASNALKALRILIDYHIERSPGITCNISVKKPVPEALGSFLAPLIEKWATAFPPDGLAKYGVTGNKIIGFLTALFIHNTTMILGQFIPGGGPIALLDSNYALQSPSQVQVNDCVGQFIPHPTSHAHIILRPEHKKEDLDSDAAIRLALPSFSKVKHCKYVGFCGSLNRFDDPSLLRSHLPPRSIFAIH